MDYLLTQNRTCGTPSHSSNNTGGCCGGGTCGAPVVISPPVVTTPDIAVSYEPPEGSCSSGPTYEPDSE